jgi:oligopeptide/dipeptide ABC transporter ATP-binding protein
MPARRRSARVARIGQEGSDMEPLIQSFGLIKRFPLSRSVPQMLRGERPAVLAVAGIDLTINRGDSVGLVGESGSGKTTVGRLLLKLTPLSGGQLTYAGEHVDRMSPARVRRFRQQAQLVFQNPFDALNPRFTIRRIVAEPLINLGVPRAEHEQRVAASLRLVGLAEPQRYLDSLPHQLSGGELQRVVLARALVIGPEFLVADEPVSMLDVSVRAGILNLMRDLKQRLSLTSFTISHDLTLVRYICSRTLVMYLGRIVEEAPTEDLILRPAHPYTRALVAAVPRPRVDQSRDSLPISGAIGGGDPPSGCCLRDRCPHAFARCSQEEPRLVQVAPGHSSACHLHQA